PKPVLRYNQFGFALGGPIQKDKTFFFADWQGTRMRTASTRVSTVPTEAMRRGDLSGLGTVFDPLTTGPDGSRTAFPGNVIPGGRMDPAVVKILSYYPLPNQPGLTNNYVLSGPGKGRADQGDIRLDHALSTSDRLMLRYSLSDADNSPSPTFATLANPANYVSSSRQQNAAASHIHNFGASAVNELRFGFNRIESETHVPTEGMDFPNQLGVPNVPPDVFPLFNVTGLTSIGTGRSSPSSSLATSYQIVDNFTWIRGRHFLKAGFDVRRSTYQPYSPTNASGEFSFTATQTANLAGGRATGGDAFGSFLLGLGSGFQFLPGLRSVLSVPSYDLYVQDDFKVSSRLTVNAGLRWEPGFPFTEKENRISDFDPNAPCAAQSPLMQGTSAAVSCARFAPAARTLMMAGVDGAPRHFYKTDWNNVGPRLGLAFSLDARTVLRAGYGIYYTTPASASNPGTPLEAAFPWARSFSVPPATRLGDALFVLSRFPGGASDFDTTGRTAGEIVWFDPESVTPYMQSWNLSFQRELMRNLSAEVAYAGTKGTHLYSPGTNLNQIPPELLGPPEQFGGATPQQRRPFPEFNNIALNTFASSSIYHALQVKVQKRTTVGLSFLLAYTFSKSIDDGSGLFPGDNPNTGGAGSFRRQNRYDQNGERSISADDQTHRLALSYGYDLPFGRGRKWLSNGGLVAGILGGWQTSGILIARSGLPFGVHMEANTAQSQGGRLRANRVCDGTLPRGERTLQRWFDTSCFVAPPPFTFGNSARNVLRAPALVNLDAMLARRIATGRKAEVELRIEAFNVFNTSHFGLPVAGVDDRRFGSISTTAGDNRTLQLGIKVYLDSGGS
ncbi:MAG TPA: TonB-dependent receptor, partial [Vicinamibacteria bacterium]